MRQMIIRLKGQLQVFIKHDFDTLIIMDIVRVYNKAYFLFNLNVGYSKGTC